MIKAVGASAGGSGASSNNNAIEVLQAKMGDLLKRLREATQDRSPGAKERLKLLQIQIQALQTQIQQLQAAAAQKAALEQLKHQQELVVAEKKKTSDATLGSVVDTLA